jgi:hypothetical protein
MADALWVTVLVVATLLARGDDRFALVVVAVASALSVLFPLDWTILVGAVAIVVLSGALAPVARRVRGLRARRLA